MLNQCQYFSLLVFFDLYFNIISLEFDLNLNTFNISLSLQFSFSTTSFVQYLLTQLLLQVDFDFAISISEAITEGTSPLAHRSKASYSRIITTTLAWQCPNNKVIDLQMRHTARLILKNSISNP